MFSVLLQMISMISLQYSIPLSGSLALALSISGGDIMNIIQVGCSVAGRGGYGGDYYGGTHGILVLEQHYTCSFTCNRQNPRQIFHKLNRQKIALSNERYI